jgi:hypothetical protein
MYLNISLPNLLDLMRISYLLLTVLLAAIAVNAVNAASGSIASFLLSYNISKGTVAVLTTTNVTYSGHSYTELFLNSNPYLLVNTTNKNSFTFVTGINNIESVIRNNTVATQINTLGLNNLESEVTDYLNSSAAPLNDCLQETGLNRGTCTNANLCNSCSIVPACNKAMYETGGPGGAIGTGIMSLQDTYSNLVSNESILKSAISGINVSNINENIGRINYAYNNISSITQSMPENPLFPPPSSVDFSQCQGFGSLTANVPVSNGPWYCNSVGFCELLTYNTTQLALANGILTGINNNAPTATYVASKAAEINSTEESIIIPLIRSTKTAELNKALNTTLANYTIIVNSSNQLLSKISDTKLSTELSTVEANYTYLKNSYLNANIMNYTSIIAVELSKLNSEYTLQDSVYNRITSLAANNTGFLIALQSVSQSPNASALAFRQNIINSEIATHISNTTSMLKNLTAISTEATALKGIIISPTEFSRSVDGPFGKALANALNLNYYQAVAVMPLLSSLPSLIIGIIIFLAIFIFYIQLKKNKRIIVNKRTSNSWKLLFIVLLALVLIYWGITYLYALQANTAAPISDFLSAELSSKSIGIVVNGSTIPGISNCINIISERATKLNETLPKVAYLTGSKCEINGNTSASGTCLNTFVKKGIPVIVFTSAQNSSMSVYSMYGTAMYASGNNAFMNECYPAYLLR